MKIGEAAKETGLSVSNIRFYEKKGLLRPRRQEESGYREYTFEDVRRLKEILLLRKAGISVESIYLLYQGDVKWSSLLKRQKQELKEQIEMLEGAIELCSWLASEEAIEEVNVDDWLLHINEEEQKGRRFAQIEEWLEDLSEFLNTMDLRYDPYVGSFFQNPWVSRDLAVFLALAIVFVAIAAVFDGSGIWGRKIIFFWMVFIGSYVMNFFYFRRKKQQLEKEEVDEQNR